MRSLAAGTDRWQADVQVTEPGMWSWSVQAHVDEWATWHHNAEIKVPAGIDAVLMVDEGAALLRRAAADGGAVFSAAAKAVGDAKRTPEERFAAASDAKLAAELRRSPIVSRTTLSLPLDLRVERIPRRGRQLVRVLPALGGREAEEGRQLEERHLPHRREAPARIVAAMGFDVIYLPPIHPIGTAFARGRTTRSRPARTTRARRGRSARRGWPRRDPPRSRHDRGLRRSSVRRRRPDSRSHSTSPSSAPPTTRGSPSIRSGSPRVGRLDRLRREPAEEVPGHLPRSTSTMTLSASATKSSASSSTGSGSGVASSASTTRTPSRCSSGSGCCTKCTRGILTSCSWPRRSPGRRCCAPSPRSDSSSRTPTSPGATRKKSSRTTCTELSQETSDYLRPNLFVNTPDILTEYLQFGGPAAYKTRAAIAATGSPTWGVYSGYELFEDVARPGFRREHRQREVRVPPP
jgi:hypothetical protein